MNDLISAIAIAGLIVFGGYIFGRVFSKGFLSELDLYLGKKFVSYLNKKEKKDGTEEKEEQEQQ